MCLGEHGLSFHAGEKFLNRKADLCNKNLSLSRELICQALNACVKEREKILNCLDGNSPCGLMGMLWKKYLGKNINVDINGQFSHSLNVIKANVESNGVDVNVIREDPCIRLRQKAYDFIVKGVLIPGALVFKAKSNVREVKRGKYGVQVGAKACLK